MGGLCRFFCRVFIQVSSSGILAQDSSSEFHPWKQSQGEAAAGAALHPLEAEYCSARFMAASLKVTAGPSFTSMVAERKGKVLGLGAPPAREMRVGGDRCCSSASCGHKSTRHIVLRVAHKPRSIWQNGFSNSFKSAPQRTNETSWLTFYVMNSSLLCLTGFWPHLTSDRKKKQPMLI